MIQKDMNVLRDPIERTEHLKPDIGPGVRPGKRVADPTVIERQFECARAESQLQPSKRCSPHQDGRGFGQRFEFDRDRETVVGEPRHRGHCPISRRIVEFVAAIQVERSVHKRGPLQINVRPSARTLVRVPVEEVRSQQGSVGLGRARRCHPHQEQKSGV